MAHSFYSRLNYSFGNEDPKTELQALPTKATDRVLCITASGDRPLHLLLNDCKELVTIDANPVQTHLLYLKMAAMRELSDQQYLDFLGAYSCSHRLKTLDRLNAHMPADTARYWKKHSRMIAKGILYQGSLERLTKKISSLLKMVRGNKIQNLFSFDHLDKQREFLQSKWNTLMWRKTINLALHPAVSRLVLRDPGLYTAAHVSPGAYLYERMNHCLSHSLAKESTLLSLIFCGKVASEAYPPYLTPQGIAAIKPKLQSLKPKTGDVIAYLEKEPDNSFDAFSLSDIASYMSQDSYNRLLHEVYRTARPGARFSIRQFVSMHKTPQPLLEAFQRDHDLEKRLEDEDRCFVYRLMIGQIRK